MRKQGLKPYNDEVFVFSEDGKIKTRYLSEH